MIKEERMVSKTSDIRRCRFSLRLVLLSFCKDVKYFPRHLFLEDITLSPYRTPWGIGAHADVFRVESDTYGLLALKFGRFREPKKYSEVSENSYAEYLLRSFDH